MSSRPVKVKFQATSNTPNARSVSAKPGRAVGADTLSTPTDRKYSVISEAPLGPPEG